MSRRRKLKKKYPNLYILIVAFAVVAFWRGIWGLLDLYLFPNSEPLSLLVSVFIGVLLLWLNDFRLDELG